jgi:hypothetical protein
MGEWVSSAGQGGSSTRFQGHLKAQGSRLEAQGDGWRTVNRDSNTMG